MTQINVMPMDTLVFQDADCYIRYKAWLSSKYFRLLLVFTALLVLVYFAENA